MRGFKLAGLNVRSLVNHIDELRVLLATSPIDVLAINETWLNPTISDNDVYIPEYDIIRRDRAFKSANGKTYEGVCFYVRSSVNFIQRKDMSIDDIENLCIQIQKPNSKPFLVATWYRPPNSNVEEFKYFETFIDMIDAENVEYYLLGDLNCDLGSLDLEGNSRLLIGITELYGLHQLINEPTRTVARKGHHCQQSKYHKQEQFVTNLMRFAANIQTKRCKQNINTLQTKYN